MMEENTPLNSEEEREEVNYMLEASCRLHRIEEEKGDKKGESSTLRGTGSGHGSLAAHIGDASGASNTYSAHQGAREDTRSSGGI